MLLPLLQIVQPAAQPASQPTTQSAPVVALFDQLELNRTIQQTPWTGWGGLLLAIFAGVVAGKVVHSVAKLIARRGEQRGWVTYATTFEAAAGPAYLWVVTAALAVGLTPISLSEPVRAFATNVLKLIFIVAIGWFLFELIALTDVLMRRLVRHSGSAVESQVVPLVRKTLRIFLVVVFVLFAAQNVFGADIGAWLAGLGIAGLAVSLAAQDSIKNLFGSLTIFLDRPFAVGERIVFDGHDGPVEEIGFRSTKIRTGNGDLVTIPNSKIVDGSVRNIGRRPNIPRSLVVGLSYETTPDEIEGALRIVRDIFAIPEIATGFNAEKNPPRVFVDELTPAAINLKVSYWYYPASDWWGYSAHAQRFNTELLRRFTDAGLAFAVPTQKFQLVNETGTTSAPMPAATPTAPPLPR